MSDPQSVSHPYGAPPIPSYAPPDESGVGQVPQAYPPPTAGPDQPWPGVPYEAPPNPAPWAVAPAAYPAPTSMTGQMSMPGNPYAPAPLPYGTVPYTQPLKPAPAGSSEMNWTGVTALVCGIVATATAVSLGSGNTRPSGVTSLLLALLIAAAISFGAAGVRAAGRREATNNGMAMTGMIMGIVWGAFMVMGVILLIASR